MTYVTSDIHGNLRRFDSVLAQIDLKPEDTLYVLGDVIDRHPEGIKILRRLMAMPNARLLPGNHELMLLHALYLPEEPGSYWSRERSLQVWYRNGGGVTHDSLLALAEAERQEIFAYLAGLPTSYDVEVKGRRYRLVHAAPEELYEKHRDQYENARECSVWLRIRPTQRLLTGQTVIFGHTPTIHFQQDLVQRIWRGRGRICVDCGSAYPEPSPRGEMVYGRLGCLRLEDMAEFYSEENIPEEEL